MSTPTLGEVRLFAGNFAPRGWHLCDGALLSIAENTALFSLLGTIYGGDGQITFALPDLRGRNAAGTGAGPGLPDMLQGETGGALSETLTVPTMPAHNHLVMASNQPGDNANPSGLYPAALNDPNGTATNNGYTGTPDSALNAGAITPAGGNMPFSTTQPYLGLNFIIAVEGIFPSRN